MFCHLNLLGPFRLISDDGRQIDVGGARAEVLIARLVIASGRPVPRSRLWELLWEDRSEEQARNSLRQLLSTVRKSLDGRSGLLAVTPHDVRIETAALSSDVDWMTADPLSGDVPEYGEFLEGVTLQGAEAQTWLASERERLRALYLDAMTRRLATNERDGDMDATRRVAEAMLRADAAHEGANRALMRVHAAAGDRSRALRQYDLCRTALREAYDAVPDSRTEALLSEIRQGSEETSAPPPAGRMDVAFDEGRISIIVLPFDPLSPGDGARYFCDSLTDSLTEGLSRYHDLTVISHRSSALYRDRRETIPDICRQLGVRYALSGSVTQAGERVRVVAQLVDGADGRIRWTEQFDQEGSDTFALQDTLTQVIVTRLGTTHGGQLRRAWARSRLETRPAEISAQDCLQRALERMDHWTPEAIRDGRVLLEEALRLDPDFAKARAKLAWNYLVDASEGWTLDVEACFRAGVAIAREAVASDPFEPWAVWVLGGAEIYSGRHDAGIAGLERAIELNPNDADLLLDYGYYLSLAGEPGTGLRAAEKALRLHPHYPGWYLTELLQIQFDARRYPDAVATAARFTGQGSRVALMLGAASHAALGQEAEAKAMVAELLRLEPGSTISGWLDPKVLPYRNAADREHLARNLEKAGLPEG